MNDNIIPFEKKPEEGIYHDDTITGKPEYIVTVRDIVNCGNTSFGTFETQEIAEGFARHHAWKFAVSSEDEFDDDNFEVNIYPLNRVVTKKRS